MDFPNFTSIHFYPLCLSNELGKYSCFIEDHHIKHNDDDDITLESKLEAFKLRGNLHTQLIYKNFYS